MGYRCFLPSFAIIQCATFLLQLLFCHEKKNQDGHDRWWYRLFYRSCSSYGSQP